MAAVQNQNEKLYTKVQEGIHQFISSSLREYMRIQIKDPNNVLGNNRENWLYFDQLDAILGTRPSSTPITLLQSGSVSAILQSQEIDGKLFTNVHVHIINTNCTVDETQIPTDPNDETFMEGYTQDEGVCTCDN